MANHYPRGSSQPKTRLNMGPRPAKKKVLRPGLKRSKTGAVVKDPNAGRVAKRTKAAVAGRGPYRRRRGR